MGNEANIAQSSEMTRQDPVLGIPGFAWADLHRPGDLARLHAAFEAWLGERG